MEEIYDLIILGGGPASMSAGVYASQMRLNTLLIEKSTFGGQIATTSSVTNYLGIENISGKELSEKMHQHLLSTKTKVVEEEIIYTDFGSTIKTVQTHSHTYRSLAVIIGIGTAVRKLGVPNENKYINHGLSYFTLRDRDHLEGKEVAIVGGGNSAIEDALYLAEKCKKVYLIHRRDQFRGDNSLIENLFNTIQSTHKIELVLNAKPKEIIGDSDVEKLIVTTIPTNEDREIAVKGVFVAIGRGADTEIIDEKISRDDKGYIITNEKMEANLPLVYAVGDIRNTPLRQIVTAVSDGAIAAVTAFNSIKEMKNRKENEK